MTPILVADVAEQVGKQVINVLAVAGSGAVGYFLTFALIWISCRMTIQRQPPKQVTKILSTLGAVACGIAAFFLLFNGAGGGGGWGFGPGMGFGTGSTQKAGPTQAQTVPVRTTQNDPGPSASALRIRILGGVKVKERRFFLVDGESSPRDLPEMKQLLRDRAKPMGEKPPIREVIIIVDNDSVARDHVAVRQLEEFVKEQLLTVSILDQTDEPGKGHRP